MEHVNMQLGSLHISQAHYDAEYDDLFLSVGRPVAAEGYDTPEDHVIHYAIGTDRIAGITLNAPRLILKREGRVTVTLPDETVELTPAELEPILR